MFDALDPTVQVHLIHPGQLSTWVASVGPHLRKMADKSGGRYEAGDIFAAIAAGRFQLWVVLEGADILCVFLSEFVVYPRLKAMRLIGIVGHRPRRWLHLLPGVERLAKQTFGCDRMEAIHQPGHERLLRSGGWRRWHIFSEKPL